jgi:hypothetical protein
MTVWVDYAFIPWKRSLWCHLTADTEAELHAFARRLGLRREWFQTCKHRCGPIGAPCPHWHYDVNVTKRALALALGAKEIDRNGMVDLIRARRAYQDPGKMGMEGSQS